MSRVLRVVAGLACAASLVVVVSAQASALTVTARWSVTVSEASAVTGPVLGANRVYVGFVTPEGTGGVRAVDVATGATLWTRVLPAPVNVAPVFVPSSIRLYVATNLRLYALDPATGATIVAGPLEGFPMYSLHYADNRVYVQTTADMTAYTPDIAFVWNRFFIDDPKRLSAPGDGFLYYNDQGVGGAQCMKKANGATGATVASNCTLDDFIVPSAAPAKNLVAGGSFGGVVGFRATNLKQRWINTRYELNPPTTATSSFGGRVALANGERMAMLQSNDGVRVCEKTFDERIFGSLAPVFDPASGSIYLFDTEGRDVYKVSGACAQVWFFDGDDDVVGFDASSSTVVGAGGRTVFAITP